MEKSWYILPIIVFSKSFLKIEGSVKKRIAPQKRKDA